VGAVKPRGWIAGWLTRQADGLTGHPENLGYPYDTCMFTGNIPPPAVPHGIEVPVKNDVFAFKVIEAPVSGNPFLIDTVPVRLEVALRPLPQWQAGWRPTPDLSTTDSETATKNPIALPDPAQMQPGETRVMTFVPYGATYLRLTTLPVIEPSTSSISA